MAKASNLDHLVDDLRRAEVAAETAVAGGAEGAEQQASSGKADDDVVDAEFEEVKDDKK